MDSVIGYGFLQPLMARDSITEIMVNADSIFYEEQGIIRKIRKKDFQRGIGKAYHNPMQKNRQDS